MNFPNRPIGCFASLITDCAYACDCAVFCAKLLYSADCGIHIATIVKTFTDNNRGKATCRPT